MKEVVKNIYAIGIKDPHRLLFDQLMPLSEGTSYNSFLIKGDKVALIDTVYTPFEPDFLFQLQELGLSKVDYIVLNHGEPDHTGALPYLLKQFPEAKIVTNQKCKEITMGLLGIEENNYLLITDKQTLDLGGKTLEFHLMPWVHWPDTMFTFVQEDKLLFTTDFLGSHMSKFDLFWEEDPKIIPFVKSYYAEIMMPFANVFKKYIPLIEEIKPKMIAPSHGPIYKNPQFILDLYKSWLSEKKVNKIVIVGVSMYGSSQKMVEYVSEHLKEKGIEVKYYDAVHLNMSEIACDLVDCMGVLVASPTVVFGPHPAVVEPLFFLNMLHPNLKYIGLMGSYSWGTKIVEQTTAFLHNLRGVPFLTPVLIKGAPRAEDFKMLDTLIQNINQKHIENG